MKGLKSASQGEGGAQGPPETCPVTSKISVHLHGLQKTVVGFIPGLGVLRV